jgi:hypothetical protein
MNPYRTLRLPSTLAPTLSAATLAFAFAFTLGNPALAEKKKEAPPAKPAAQYAAFDTHPNEHVTIAADPCIEPKDCSFFRLPYVEHGFIPVRVIVTNDGDTALSLDDARIQFISADNDKIPAATLDDINRRLFSTRSAMGTKIPLTPITIHHDALDKKVIEDDADFGFQSTTVKPHTTLAGYLFYDVRNLDDPPLKGAELYLKMIHPVDNQQQLFAFTIPFNKWLEANPGQKPAKQADRVSTQDTPAVP